MEVAEEMGLIGFDILWQGESGGLPVRRRYQREESQKKSSFTGSNDGIPNCAREPKMEIPV
jgi:hypothetical protein